MGRFALAKYGKWILGNLRMLPETLACVVDHHAVSYVDADVFGRFDDRFDEIVADWEA